MTQTRKLRNLIERKEILVAPGAFDALSAKLIESVGFEAVYMTGFGTAASVAGFPDIGLLTMTEMVENAKRISNAVKIPVIADANTGYGNQLNVVRTLCEYEKAGVSAIHIEDQVFPKRCGHMEGHKLISVEEMVAKIRAAALSRKDKDFVLIARSDGISAEGFDQAIQRGNTYLAEGADVVFLDAPRTMEQLEKIPNLLNGPVLLSLGPKTPYMHSKRFEEMGYSVIIYPIDSITTAFLAIRAKLIELRDRGIVEEWVDKGIPFDELVNFLRLKEYRDMEERFFKKGLTINHDG